MEINNPHKRVSTRFQSKGMKELLPCDFGSLSPISTYLCTKFIEQCVLKLGRWGMASNRKYYFLYVAMHRGWGENFQRLKCLKTQSHPERYVRCYMYSECNTKSIAVHVIRVSSDGDRDDRVLTQAISCSIHCFLPCFVVFLVSLLEFSVGMKSTPRNVITSYD